MYPDLFDYSLLNNTNEQTLFQLKQTLFRQNHQKKDITYSFEKKKMNSIDIGRCKNLSK